jgi:hypothetical protein
MNAVSRRDALKWTAGVTVVGFLGVPGRIFAEGQTPELGSALGSEAAEGTAQAYGFTVLDPAVDIQAVIDEINSLPFEGIGIISGKVDYERGFSKLQRLDIAPRSNFTFIVRRDVNAVYIVAKEVYIQNPPSLEDISNITYRLLDDLSGPARAKAANGRSWRVDWWDDNGEHGGSGADGQTGNPGLSYDAPTIYFVFQKLTVQNATPETSTILSFAFDGANGGNGGYGGEGGNGGNGARGKPARDGSFLGVPTCISGPGRGGDSGKPGSGGRGGDAGNGGAGGNIVIICPPSEAAKLAFAASFQPGRKGASGQPGSPGRRGSPGGGGRLSPACRAGRPGGNMTVEAPRDYGPGNEGTDGQRGSYYVVYRDNTDLFP